MYRGLGLELDAQPQRGTLEELSDFANLILPIVGLIGLFLYAGKKK